jgi:MOSC domain-containing protein YiiM
LKNRKAARRTCSITTPPSPICAPSFRAAAAWPGSVCARRPAPRAAIRGVDSARLTADAGIEGDHRAARGGGKRQVTLIQQEHLGAIAALAGFDAVDPALLRRNLVVSGISLVALKDRCFRIGEAVLEGTGDCHPCSRMEENLGPGGYNAMRGHGGITARVLQSGLVRVSDTVQPCAHKVK